MNSTLEVIKELAIRGLLNDGGHHKQWFLEEIIKAAGFDLNKIREELEREDYIWEPGIIP